MIPSSSRDQREAFNSTQEASQAVQDAVRFIAGDSKASLTAFCFTLSLKSGLATVGSREEG